MRFTKVDENTITCIISKEELDEYDIDLDDFINKNKKVREFMDYIIAEARDQMGYEMDEGTAVQLQLQPLPDKGLAITLIKDKFDMEEMAKLLGDKLGSDFLKSMDSIKKHLNKKKNENAEGIEVNQGNSEEKEIAKISPLTIYRFTNMREIGTYCKNIINETKLKSSVIIDEDTRILYLILEQGDAKLQEYLISCRMLIEYGTFDSNSYKRLAFLEERYKYYITNNAIQTLKELYS